LAAFVGTASAGVITFEVQAFVDGRSLLIFQGDTLQWHNLTWTAPGIPGSDNYPTTISSTLNAAVHMNAVNWYPSWPGGSFGDQWSSVLTGMDPDMPGAEALSVNLTVLQARDALSILTLPSSGNGYQLILDFDDDTSGGAAWYGARVTIETTDASIPEPASVALAGAGLALLLWWRKRRG
jgi:hypothetical protein